MILDCKEPQQSPIINTSACGCENILNVHIGTTMSDHIEMSDLSGKDSSESSLNSQAAGSAVSTWSWVAAALWVVRIQIKSNKHLTQLLQAAHSCIQSRHIPPVAVIHNRNSKCYRTTNNPHPVGILPCDTIWYMALGHSCEPDSQCEYLHSNFIVAFNLISDPRDS